jgi:hypothetical protein
MSTSGRSCTSACYPGLATQAILHPCELNLAPLGRRRVRYIFSLGVDNDTVHLLSSRPAFLRTGVLTILGGLVLVLGGCTGGAAPKNGDGTAVLTCRDSPGQQGIDTAPATLVNGVDGFIGDTNAYDTLPTWGKIDGHRYLAWKTGLAVAPDARPFRTVSVVSPASARLVYGSHVSAPSRAVRFPACGRRYTFYAGDILVTDRACVTLAVAGPAGAEATVVVPVLVSRC